MSNKSKHKYIVFNGTGEIEIEADSVAVVVDGCVYELTYRMSDGEVSLSIGRGNITITPVASNVVRIGNKQL